MAHSTYMGGKLVSGANQARLTKGGSISNLTATPVGRMPKWKRIIDLALLAATAPAWIMVGAGVAAWVATISRGPVFFKQERVGLGGRRFTIWKFRTMRVGVNERKHRQHVRRLIERNAPLTKLDAVDDRLLPGAKMIRGLGLDELAQIINVARGEMSFVGPRPCTVEEFAQCADSSRARFRVVPGITGYWQVNGKNRTTFRRMLALDRAYARRMSPGLDFLILARTLPAVIAQVRDLRRSRGLVNS